MQIDATLLLHRLREEPRHNALTGYCSNVQSISFTSEKEPETAVTISLASIYQALAGGKSLKNLWQGKKRLPCYQGWYRLQHQVRWSERDSTQYQQGLSQPKRGQTRLEFILPRLCKFSFERHKTRQGIKPVGLLEAHFQNVSPEVTRWETGNETPYLRLPEYKAPGLLLTCSSPPVGGRGQPLSCDPGWESRHIDLCGSGTSW